MKVPPGESDSVAAYVNVASMYRNIPRFAMGWQYFGNLSLPGRDAVEAWAPWAATRLVNRAALHPMLPQRSALLDRLKSCLLRLRGVTLRAIRCCESNEKA